MAQPVSSAVTAQSASFRVQFGLQADPDFIATVQSNPTATLELGVPLLPTELADLQHRNEIADAAFGLQPYLENDPRFGGMWMDQAAGGVVVIDELGSDVAFEQAISSALPSGTSLRFAPARYPFAQLTAIRDAAEGAQDALARSLGLSLIAIDPVSNAVTLGLDPYSTAGAEALQKAYGEAVHVTSEPIDRVTTCVSADNCPDPSYKGGLGIYNTYGGTGWCTSGFAAGKVTGGTANHWYMLTAGHCIEFKGGLDFPNWLHSGSVLGIAIAYQSCDRCAADVGVLSIPAWDTPTNAVLANSTADIRSIASSKTNAQQGVGSQGCHRGHGIQAFNCGQVDMANADHQVTEPDGTVRWQNHNWRLNTVAASGDSGGPVMYLNAAMGVTEAGSSYTWYSTIDWSVSALGYRPCITATANPCS